MGTYLTGTYSVLHIPTGSGSTTVDFDNFVYSAIYCSNTNTFTINGVIVNLVAGETLEVVVDGNTTVLPPKNDILFLGNPIAPQTKVKTGLISGDSHNEVWQFVNIKTGLPTNG